MNRTHRIALLTAVAAGACAPAALAANEPIVNIRTSAQRVLAEGLWVTPDGAKVTYDTVMSDPGGGSNITKVEFDLDGSGSYEWSSTDPLKQASWTYFYNAGPARTIKARLTNTFGKTGETSIKLKVNAYPKPTLDLPVDAVAGEPVVLDGSASTDDEGGLSFAFDPEGTGTFGTPQPQAMLRHTFAQPGTYTVRLAVTDRYGLVNVVNRDITVRAPTPSVTRVTGTTARLAGKLVPVAIACEGQTRCAGTLRLASRGEAKFTPLAYDIAGGATATLQVPANKKARQRIRRPGGLATTATGAGPATAITVTR